MGGTVGGWGAGWNGGDTGNPNLRLIVLPPENRPTASMLPGPPAQPSVAACGRMTPSYLHSGANEVANISQTPRGTLPM